MKTKATNKSRRRPVGKKPAAGTRRGRRPYARPLQPLQPPPPLAPMYDEGSWGE